MLTESASDVSTRWGSCWARQWEVGRCREGGDDEKPIVIRKRNAGVPSARQAARMGASVTDARQVRPVRSIARNRSRQRPEAVRALKRLYQRNGVRASMHPPATPERSSTSARLVNKGRLLFFAKPTAAGTCLRRCSAEWGRWARGIFAASGQPADRPAGFGLRTHRWTTRPERAQSRPLLWFFVCVRLGHARGLGGVCEGCEKRQGLRRRRVPVGREGGRCQGEIDHLLI